MIALQAQKVGRGIALLFHDRGARRGWVVSSTPRPHFTPGKDPVPIVQEAGWDPGPVWKGGKSCPQGDSIPDRPASSQSLYRLSYSAHHVLLCVINLSKNAFSEVIVCRLGTDMHVWQNEPFTYTAYSAVTNLHDEFKTCGLALRVLQMNSFLWNAVSYFA